MWAFRSTARLTSCLRRTWLVELVQCINESEVTGIHVMTRSFQSTDIQLSGLILTRMDDIVFTMNLSYVSYSLMVGLLLWL